MHTHQFFCHLRHRVDNSRESIDENNESNNGGREEPSRVETNPCEVDTYLFTKVTPNKQSIEKTEMKILH